MIYSEAVVWRCSVEKVFLEISQNAQENTCVRVSFSIKLQAWCEICSKLNNKDTRTTPNFEHNSHQACNFIKKETLAQVFSCEFCEIFKNMFFYRTPPVTASEKHI